MTIWIDAQLSPAIAVWLTVSFSVTALAVRDVGLRDAEDREIFLEARRQSAVVLTKDSDFVLLQNELGAAEDNLADLRKYLKCRIEKNFIRHFIGSREFFGVRRRFG